MNWKIIGGSIWGLVTLIAVFPTSFYYQMHSVEVTDKYKKPDQPGTRILILDRTIRFPFQGEYRVEEQYKKHDMAYLTTATCYSPKIVEYSPDKTPPVPPDVNWWTYGPCDGTPPVFTPLDGTYRLCTWHRVLMLGLYWKWADPVCSPDYQGKTVFWRSTFQPEPRTL